MQGDSESEGLHGARAALAGGGDLKEPWLRPTTVEETADIVRSSTTLVTLSAVTLLSRLDLPWAKEAMAMHWSSNDSTDSTGAVTVVDPEIDSLFEVSPEDFIVTVPAGWSTFRLNEELEPLGLVVPRYGAARHQVDMESNLSIALGMLFDGLTVCDGVGWNFPHILEGQHGTWRDWILDTTFITADGEVCRSGARVSKNVAGFDIHKFLIGSRGAFVVPVSFTLRVIPRASLQEPDLIFPSNFGDFHPAPLLIQRVMPSDFDAACGRLDQTHWFADRSTRTIFMVGEPEGELARYSGDWVMNLGRALERPEYTPAETWALKRAKELFDPTNKLNPGILGVV